MNSAQPRVMCARCQATFAEPENVHAHATVTCPECGHEGAPRGVMHAATFPSLDAFKHNWHASQQADNQNQQSEHE